MPRRRFQPGISNHPKPRGKPTRFPRFIQESRFLSNLPIAETEKEFLYLLVQVNCPPEVPWPLSGDNISPYAGWDKGHSHVVRLRNNSWEEVLDLSDPQSVAGSFGQNEGMIPGRGQYGYYGPGPYHWISIGDNDQMATVAYQPPDTILRTQKFQNNVGDMVNILDPTRPSPGQTIFWMQIVVAADGVAWGLDANFQIWRSIDNFENWEHKLDLNEFMSTVDINDGFINVECSIAVKASDSNFAAAYVIGVFDGQANGEVPQVPSLAITQDGGTTWIPVQTPWPYFHEPFPPQSFNETDGWEFHVRAIQITENNEIYFMLEVIESNLPEPGFPGSFAWDEKWLLLGCSRTPLDGNSYSTKEVFRGENFGKVQGFYLESAWTIYGPYISDQGNGKYFTYTHENWGAQAIGFNNPDCGGKALIFMSSTPGDINSWNLLPDPGYFRSTSFCYWPAIDSIFICNREPTLPGKPLIKMMKAPSVASEWIDVTKNLHSLFGGVPLNVIGCANLWVGR